jgi:diguanylate cyclase (GGDEF)-like protein
MEDLRRLYRQSLPPRITALEAARKGIEDRAPDARTSAGRIAHVLRGSGGTYGFPEITEAARRFEETPEPECLPALEALIDVLRRVASGDTGAMVRILLVEGDPDRARRLQEKLATPGREIRIAASAAEAEQFLDAQEVALVLLNLNLPDTDGRNLVLRLRERPRSAGTPLVVFSERANAPAKAECFALGADDFVERPTEGDLLAAAVSARLHRAAEMAQVSRIDPLTGLPNRTAFKDAYDRAWATALRVRFPLALAVIDIDHFKSVNDSAGHAAGDEVLRRTASVIARILRTTDIVARWGGDEFVALFVNAPLDGALLALDRVRLALAEERFTGPDGKPFPVTLTAGAARIADSDTLESAFAKADRLLYQGKAAGRNRVFSERDAQSPVLPKVLLVEDDAETATLIRRYLEEGGYEVIHHADGQAALEASWTLEASLVILDRKLPDMDGLDLIAQLRRQIAFARVPIVMLTVLGSEKEVVQGFALGADDYIVKPFSPPELMARIQRLLRKT